MSKILLHLAVCALCSVSAVAQNTKDAATYAPTATGEQLTNLYLNSAILNGGNAVLPGGVAGDARGMAVVNGKMYVCCREGAVSKLIELDGKTGALLRTINLPGRCGKRATRLLALSATTCRWTTLGISSFLTWQPTCAERVRPIFLG